MQKFERLETGFAVGVAEENPRDAYIQNLVLETQELLIASHEAKTRLNIHETVQSQELMEKARGSFNQLVEETHKEVYTLARRLTGDDEDAHDVTQDAFLRAWRGLPKFRGDAKFTTWMYRITTNATHNFQRKKNRHRHSSIDEFENADSISMLTDKHFMSDVEGRGVALDIGRRILELTDVMSPRLREVIIRHDVYGEDRDKITEDLGVSKTAFKVRLHRARRFLKEALEANPEQLK